MSEPVTVSRETTPQGDIAWVIIDNPPVNATSTAVRAGLLNAVAQVRGARIAVLRGAGRTFVAGGDMTEFDAPPAVPHLPDVVQAIEDSETPFLALLHGNVLGGGLELALACTWRIAAPETRFGLPEVRVGLIPGAGGSQRLPRLIGFAASIPLACEGELIRAQDFAALGGLDSVSESLDEAARALARDLPPRPVPLSQRPPLVIDPQTEAQNRARLEKSARGARAPVENLEALTWAALPFAEGQPRERERHLALRSSRESRALRHAFFAERAVSHPAAIASARARSVEHAAVVGGGLMGAGIATAMLNAGLSVTLIERDVEAAEAGAVRVQGLIEAGVKRGKISEREAAARRGRLTATANMEDAAGADLGLEAVFEDVDVKRKVIGQLAQVMRPDALLATNTSYLDPRDIFAGIKTSARLLGLHFFSPAHIMKLVEVVRLPSSSAETLATGFALTRRLGKVPVLAGICDGFIGNRMLAAYRRAADYMLADGSLPHEVDAAMRVFGMPMGPYEMQDMAGLQIAWANRKRQAATRPPAERYVDIADRLCEAGRLGQRSGAGWYRYEDGSRTPLPAPEVAALIEAWSAEHGITRRSFSPEDIAERLVAVLANEGALIVAEGIADSAEAIDMVEIHGYGFPRWRGGPMHYGEEIGWDRIAETMAQLAAESPGSWRLAAAPDAARARAAGAD